MNQKNNIIEEIKIDAKDRKILKELFDNARVPFSILGRNIGMSKEMVHYRVNRLIKEGLILRFNTIIDVKKLGWEIYFVFIKLRNIDLESESLIMDHLNTHENLAWLVKCIGSYDLIIKIFARNYSQANAIMKDIETKFKAHVDAYEIGFIEEERAVPLTFLYESDRKGTQMIERKEKEIVKLSSIETKILKHLAHKARLSTSELALEIKQSRDLVKYHLKKLEQNKIILKYRPSMWHGIQKLGYTWYFVVLKVGKLNKEISSMLKTFIINQLHVTYYYQTVGNSDIQIEIRVKTSAELNNILMELRGILKNVLKHHEIMVILQEYKYTYAPDCLFVDSN